MVPQKSFDVVICGGGLAGLTLCRQLRRRYPDMNVAIVDRQKSPLPEAAFKVGESSVHPGGTYLCKVLDLHEYLDRRHIE